MNLTLHDPRIRPELADTALPGIRADTSSVLLRAAPLGTTPLCWRQDGNTLHIAAQPADLARLSPVAAADEPVLRSLLRWNFPAGDASPFREVHRVPSGCQARITPAGGRLERWWTVAPEPGGDSPAVDIWRGLVRQCADILRLARRGAVMLSGGIDSSAIAAAAVAASRELGQPLPVLLSAVYPGLDCDEQPAQAAVARHLGAPHVVHDATRVALWPALGEAVRVSLSPLVDGQEGINLGLYQAAREQGCDVVLHGAGGDELFEGRGLEVDLMRSGRWIQAAGLIHSALIARPGPTVRTWLRRGLRYPIQPARMGPRTADRVEAGSWCRALVRRTLADSGLDWRLEMAERTARRAGLRFAAPYLESGFLGEYERISSPELACGGVFKGQLRRSLAGRLPSDVVTNLKKVRLAAYYRARLAVDGEPMSRAYAELIKDYPVDWLPRSIGHLLKRPISPQEFLPLWMGLAILLFIDALSNTSRRIR